jgi:low affinity Fe/Cu permease
MAVRKPRCEQDLSESQSFVQLPAARCIQVLRGAVEMSDDQNPKKTQPNWFARFAAHSSSLCGSRWAFIAALSVIFLWGITGPLFRFSDTWQLIINTGTTIVTFLMVFLIQNTQNRDARAINLKLDEIIRATTRADNEVIDIEKLSDEQLDILSKRYEKIRQLSDARREAHGRQNKKEQNKKDQSADVVESRKGRS